MYLGDERKKALLKRDACVAKLNYLNSQYENGEVSNEDYNIQFDYLKNKYDAFENISNKYKRRK